MLIRSFDIDIRCSYDVGDEGILVAHGDQGGGYLVWIEDGAVAIGHNDGRGRFSSTPPYALTPGEHVITAHFDAPGGNVWNVSLSIDGIRIDGVAAHGWSVLFPMAPFEGIDVGADRRSPVCWRLYEAHGFVPVLRRRSSRRPTAPAPRRPTRRSTCSTCSGRWAPSTSDPETSDAYFVAHAAPAPGPCGAGSSRRPW